MFVSKLKITVLSLLLVAAGVTGAGFLARAMAINDDVRISSSRPAAGCCRHGG